MTKTNLFLVHCNYPWWTGSDSRGRDTENANQQAFFYAIFMSPFSSPEDFATAKWVILWASSVGQLPFVPPLFHPNEKAEMKGHDVWKPPGSTLCSPAKQGPHGFKRRNSVGANSDSIIYPRSNWAACGDTSHDTWRKQQPLKAGGGKKFPL